MKMNLNMLVAGHTPPQEGEDDMYRTSPAQCIPIAPATSHPEQRAPLVPSNPLPWPEGCHLHTLQTITAFVSRIHHAEPGKTTALTEEDMSRVLHLSTKDQYNTPRTPGRQDAEEGDGDGHGETYESEGSYYSWGSRR